MPTILKPAQFAEEFAKVYFTRGFGSMNKNELEVLIFHLLKKHGDIDRKSNFQLACDLHLPESKIKRLAYEAELLYGVSDKTEFQTRFLELLGNAKIQKENGTLRFVVEDKFLRSIIYEDLKQAGYYLDSSFNSEIVSIQKEALVALLDLYFKEEHKSDILEAYKKVRRDAKKADGEGLSFKEMMSIVFDKALDKGVEAALDGIKDVDYSALIKSFSRGIAGIGAVIHIITTIASVF